MTGESMSDPRSGETPVPTHKVDLTDSELVLLDGAVSEKVQAEVEQAKARLAAMAEHSDLPPRQAALIADVVAEALAEGRLIFRNESITYCRLCRRSGGYVRFKSGRNKGREDINRPIRLAGREFARRFVTVRHHISVGGCTDCVDPVLPRIAEALRGVPAQVPERLRAEGEPERKRFDRTRCTKCGWEGHEGEMGRLRTLMNDGTYPGKCPSCGVVWLPLSGSPFESLNGFVIVEAERV